MTLSNESRKSQLFTGSGSTGPFPFTFKVFAKEDLVVTTSVIATGVETTLALDTDYTVLLNKDQDGNPGGSVTLLVALPTTKRLLISGGMALTQPQEIGNQDGFFAEDIENALDRAMIAAQQLKVDVDRAFKLPLTSGYTNPDAFISDLLETDQSAQEAQVAAEAAQAAAEVAQVAAEAAQTGAETAQTNAENYVDTISSASSAIYDSYVDAVAALNPGGGPVAPSGTVFRVKDGGLYYVYTWYSVGLHGVLENIVPVDGIGATTASAASGGVTPSGLSMPAGALVDISAIDGSYNHNQIRNRAVTGKPDLNLLGNIKPSKQPLRTSIGVVSTGTPTGTPLVFEYDDSGTIYELLVNNTPSAISAPYDTQSVRVSGLSIPAGQWTLAFRAKSASPITDFDFRCSINGQALATKTALGSGWSTFSISHTFTTEQANAYVEFCKEASNQTTPSFIYFEDIRLIPGSSATYTEPAERHGWHRKPWVIAEDAFVPSNDSLIVDNLHFQVPFAEQKRFEQITFSLAVKPSSNDAVQATNVTDPDSGAPFAILLTPSEQFFVGGAGGFIGMNGLGSSDDSIQALEVGLPKDQWSILTVSCPAEQGINSDATKIYLNGIKLKDIEKTIRVASTSQVSGAGGLIFNFNKNHLFVEGQPVTVVTTGLASALPGGITAGQTYYVRLPAANPTQTLQLSETPTGALIPWSSDGVGSVFVQSQKRPVGLVAFDCNMMSILGFKDLEPSGANFKGEFGNLVVYDRALTDAEVRALVAVQKTRVASYYEQIGALGTVLITEGDSITDGVGTSSPNETFRFRLFYGLNFNQHTTTTVTSTTNTQSTASIVADNITKTTSSVTDDSSKLLLNFPFPHTFYTPNAVTVTSSGTLPSGLVAGTTYYVRQKNATSFYLVDDDDPTTPVKPFVDAGTGNVVVTLVTSQASDDDGTLALTYNGSHPFKDGDAVQLTTGGTLPGGLNTGQTYYTQVQSLTKIYLADSADPSATPKAFVNAGTGPVTATLNTSRMLLTFAADHNFIDRDPVVVSGGSLPANLSSGTTYYIRYRSDKTVQLVATQSLDDIAIDYAAGSATVDWNAAKILLTFPEAHGYSSEDAVQLSASGAIPQGLDLTKNHFARALSSTTMSLAYPNIYDIKDFITAGTGSVTIRAFVPELDPTAVKLNAMDFAVAGDTVQDVRDRVPSVVAAIEQVVAEGSRAVVTYMAGMNDLIAGLGAAGPLDSAAMDALEELYKESWTAYRNAGAKLIVCTITAANENDVPGDPLIETLNYTEATRLELNSRIRNLSAYYDALADFGATDEIGTWQPPLIGDPPTTNPKSYFADNIHPRFFGHIVMSNILSPLIDSFRL